MISKRAASSIIFVLIFGFIVGMVLLLTLTSFGKKTFTAADDTFTDLLPCGVDLDGDGLIQDDDCPCGPTFYVLREDVKDNSKIFNTNPTAVSGKPKLPTLTQIKITDVGRLQTYYTNQKEYPATRTLSVSKELMPYLKTGPFELKNFCWSVTGGTCSFSDFMTDHLVLNEEFEYQRVCNVTTADCKKQLKEACAKAALKES